MADALRVRILEVGTIVSHNQTVTPIQIANTEIRSIAVKQSVTAESVNTQHLSGETMAVGEVTVSGHVECSSLRASADVSVGGNADIGGDANVGGDAIIGGNTAVSGSASIGTDIHVVGKVETGACTVAGSATVSGGLSVVGGLAVDTCTVTGNQTVNGTQTVSSGLVVSGGITVDTSAVNGNQSVGGTQIVLSGLSVTGGVTTDSSLVTGNQSVAGTQTVLSGLSVTGGLTADNSSITGNQSISGNQNVDGTQTVLSGLSVTGGLTADNSSITGNQSISGNQNVDGTQTVLSGLSVTGGLTTDSSSVTGNQTVTGTQTVYSGMDVAGGFSADIATITGSQSVGGVLSVTGNANIAGTLVVSGDGAFSAGLSCSGFQATDGRVMGKRLSGGQWYRVCTLSGGSRYLHMRVLNTFVGNDWNDGVFYMRANSTGNFYAEYEVANVSRPSQWPQMKIFETGTDRSIYIRQLTNNDIGMAFIVAIDEYTAVEWTPNLGTADTPNGETGTEIFNFTLDGTGIYPLSVKRFGTLQLYDAGLYLPNSAGGTVSALEHYEESTAAVTFTGPWSTGVAATLDFRRVGSVVTLFVPQVVDTADTASSISLASAINTRFRPANTTSILVVVIDNGTIKIGVLQVTPLGQVLIYSAANKAAFVGSGFTGLSDSVYVTYSV